MAVAASAPSLASLLTQETGSDGVLITGGVVVRVHSCFRSFLSPDFFLNTGLALKPDVDFTFDLEVCDGVEKVRGPSLSGARLRLFLTTRTSLHSTFRAHKIRAGDGDAAPGPKCRVRSRIDRERCARRARPCDSAQGCRIFPQTVRHPRFQFCAIGRIHFTAVFGDTLAPPLRTLLLPCPTLVRQRSPNPICRRLGVLVHSLRFLERQPRNVELGALDAEKGIDIVPGHGMLAPRRPVFTRRSR